MKESGCWPMPRAGSSASEASAVFHQSETNYSANESFETIDTILEIYMLVPGGVQRSGPRCTCNYLHSYLVLRVVINVMGQLLQRLDYNGRSTTATVADSGTANLALLFL